MHNHLRVTDLKLQDQTCSLNPGTLGFYLHLRHMLAYCFFFVLQNNKPFHLYTCNSANQLRWWRGDVVGYITMRMVHHCINLLSDALCGSIFRGVRGEGISVLRAVPAPVTLIIVPLCCLLQGQSSKCHGTSG